MLIFLDTEFVDFDCPVEGLIALGLVTEDGRTFYGINKDIGDTEGTAFVCEHVHPVKFEQTPDFVEPLAALAHRFRDWLEVFDEPITFAVDYAGDWVLVRRILAMAGCEAGTLLGNGFKAEAVYVTQALYDRDPLAPAHGFKAAAEAYFTVNYGLSKPEHGVLGCGFAGETAAPA